MMARATAKMMRGADRCGGEPAGVAAATDSPLPATIEGAFTVSDGESVASTAIRLKTDSPWGENASTIRFPSSSVPTIRVSRISDVPSLEECAILMASTPPCSSTHSGLTVIRMVAPAISSPFSRLIRVTLMV